MNMETSQITRWILFQICDHGREGVKWSSDRLVILAVPVKIGKTSESCFTKRVRVQVIAMRAVIKQIARQLRGFTALINMALDEHELANCN